MPLQEIANASVTSGEKCVDQVNLLSDGFPRVLQEEHESSFSTENYLNSSNRVGDGELPLVSQEILSVVNSHDKCAIQESSKLDDATLLPQKNSKILKDLDATSFIGETSLSTNDHESARMTNCQSREVSRLVHLTDEYANQEGKLSDVSSIRQRNSKNLFSGKALDTGNITNETCLKDSHHDAGLTNCQSRKVLGLIDDEYSNQDDKLSDGDVSLLSQEKSGNLFNTEGDLNSDSIISGTDLNTYTCEDEKTTSCVSRQTIDRVNSYDKCASEEDDSSDASSSREGNTDLSNNEEHLNTDSITIETGVSTSTHKNEMTLSCESENILGLPVNLSFSGCDQQCSLDDNVHSLQTVDNYQDDSEDVDYREEPCLNKSTAVHGLKSTESVHHRALNQVKKKHVCDVCTKEFRRKGALLQHTRVHTGERPFACYNCEKRFMDKKTLTRHIRIHTGEKTFACEICKKAFREKKNLIQHVFIHTGEQPYACEVCQKRFKARRDLRIHFATHSDEKPFSCDVCEKHFHSQNALNKHLRNHFISKEKIYVCGVCQKAFKNNGSLNDHLVVHTGDKPHTCHICQSSFTRRSSLSRHLLRHTAAKPFVCQLCPKAFSLKYHLTQHIRTHSDDKPFVCEVCCSAFRNVSALNAHFATHTGERPHDCNICQSTFTRKSSLKRHFERHHCSGKLAGCALPDSDNSGGTSYVSSKSGLLN